MRNIRYSVLGAIVAIALIGFGAVLGQSPTPLLGKAQVEISQDIPVLADLVVPIGDGESITTSVPLTMSVKLLVSLSGATVTKVEPTAEQVPTPAIEVRDAQSVPGMAGVDELGVPYTLNVPAGLILNKWEVKENEDGGLAYSYEISTPGKKFASDLHVNVSYRGDDDSEIATDGVMIWGAMNSQDRKTRSYTDSFECGWTKCAGITERAKSYVITFEVDLVDFP